MANFSDVTLNAIATDYVNDNFDLNVEKVFFRGSINGIIDISITYWDDLESFDIKRIFIPDQEFYEYIVEGAKDVYFYQ